MLTPPSRPPTGRPVLNTTARLQPQPPLPPEPAGSECASWQWQRATRAARPRSFGGLLAEHPARGDDGRFRRQPPAVWPWRQDGGHRRRAGCDEAHPAGDLTASTCAPIRCLPGGRQGQHLIGGRPSLSLALHAATEWLICVSQLTGRHCRQPRRFGVIWVIEDHRAPSGPYNARYTGDHRSSFRVRFAEKITRISLVLNGLATVRPTGSVTLRDS
jgi:hypothetical protein